MAHEALFANARTFDPGSGEWINENFQRIAEILYDLNPEIRLMWIPESRRTATDLTPYAVAHMKEGHEPYIFMYISEDEMDERVIARILGSQSDTLLERIDHQEAAAELLQAYEAEQRQGQAIDIAVSMARSNKHHYVTPSGRAYNL